MKVTKVTQIDYAILGLVSQEPLSGYKIRMAFEKTALGNFSSSPGTIYPALKRLVSLRHLEKKKRSETRKGPVDMAITKSGIQVLRDWFHSPVGREEVTKNRDLLLLRFAFMDGLVTVPSMISFLASFEASVTKYIKELEEFHTSEAPKLPVCGRLAVEHGIASYKATMTWCRAAQKHLKEKR
jgi:DNA-binding PadR family transcriptional regulator